MNYKILEMHTNFGAPQTNVIRIFEKKNYTIEIFQNYDEL